MKSINKIALFLISLSFCACNENLKLNENDILKHEYLKPFILIRKSAFKGSHNIDSEKFEFSYKVKNIQNAIIEIDERAEKEKWIKKNNTNIISYSKKIEIYKSELTIVTVYIKVLKSSNIIYFEVK